jgi:uncharacterized protein (DUF58 family)
VTVGGDERTTFPLVSRRRAGGLPFGDVAGRRPGHGSDSSGLRAYEPGDPPASIDWFASARLSALSGRDEFVVRRRVADEAPRVVLVVDRRPAMALYPEPLPWLSKRAALREAVAALVASAGVARADVGSLDFAEGEPFWLAPGRRDRPWQVVERQGSGGFAAPDDTIRQALAFLARRRTEVRPGSFVFVLSDFLVGPGPAAWQDAVGQGWDLVPVVISDPVWETSFPPVGGVAVPVADPRGGRVRLVRLGRRAAAARRELHERRYAALLTELEALELRPVTLTTSEPAAVDAAFVEWAEERRRRRWLR